MGVGEALALGFGTTVIGMAVTFVTLFGLAMILESMSILSKHTSGQH